MRVFDPQGEPSAGAARGGMFGWSLLRRFAGPERHDLDLVALHLDPEFCRFVSPALEGASDRRVVRHFLSDGWRSGLDPTADFSMRGYLAANPDVAAAGVNPFLHYLSQGREEGRATRISDWGDPDALSLPGTEVALLDGVFDPDFYRVQLTGADRLSDRALACHFLAVGFRQGLDPCPAFSVELYQRLNPDVVAAGLNPLHHYLSVGRGEGRVAFGSRRTEALARAPFVARAEDRDAARPHFDADFYRRRNPDLRGSDERLLDHYLMTGWTEGREPRADFDSARYLARHPDAAGTRSSPLLHHAHRQPAPEGRAAAMARDLLSARVKTADLDCVRDRFDPAFYRGSNPDLSGSDEDLLVHFMAVGWRENRDPAPDFSCDYYRRTYADIAAADINPFLHFVLHGETEGRRPCRGAAIRLAHDPDARLVPDHLGALALAADAATAEVTPPATSDAACLTLHWIVPDFSPGSGGHQTIFRMVRFLELFGHRCKIWIETPRFHATPEDAWETIVKHFQCLRAEVAFAGPALFEARGDAVIATAWTTAYLAAAATGFRGRFYFVQDHEVEFYPMGSERLLARGSYDLGLDCICASPWLQAIMTRRYGAWARHFHLAYDHETYRIEDADAQAKRHAPERSAPYRIAVYARDHTERRCVMLVTMALERLSRIRDDFEVHLFGQDPAPFRAAPFRALTHGVLDAEGLAALYNACDVGICLSATNYSLVPQEMMACGLPVLELDGESTRAIFPPGVVTLAGPDPADICARLDRLLSEDAARGEQADRALAWARAFTWQDAAHVVEDALRDRLCGSARSDAGIGPDGASAEAGTADGATPHHAPAHMDAPGLGAPSVAATRSILLDVVIPTHDGLDEIKPVIAALRRQRAREALRIVCIDSSSTDGTTEWLRAQPDIDLTVIPQAEFQHGRTRNQGASAGGAPLIAFLTQDAVPVRDSWASDIIGMFDHVPEAAGLFGRHKPHPHHPEFVRDEITRHFEGFLRYPLKQSKDTDPERWESGDVGWRQVLHFYSDNNSAMRRAIWTDIPYPEIDYGEDQLWAQTIIEAGHVKLYAPTASVYHSHDYDPGETYARARTEGRFFREHFGYRLGAPDGRDLDLRIRREQAAFRAWAHPRNLPEADRDRRLAVIEQKHRGLKDGMDEADAALAAAAPAIAGLANPGFEGDAPR